MKNYLLGFLTACAITLSVLSAALMWVLWIYHKATKHLDGHCHAKNEHTDGYMDYSKCAEAADEQD